MRKRLIIGLVLAACVLFLCAFTNNSTNKPNARDGHYRNFYEIFVGGFYDANGDGMGDLRGITKKLDYLNDGTANSLGISGIWLMPVMPSPTYHKYDVTDYLAIDQQYGTMEDFEELVRECKNRDIALIIDLVLNHSSKEHAWFADASVRLEQSPYYGYYYFSETNEPGWHKLANGHYYKGHFGSHMPDLNLDNPAVREEIGEIVRFWLEKGVDGFRLDAALHFFSGNSAKNAEFLGWLTHFARGIKPDAFFVGEVWTDGGAIAEHYRGIDSLFNFPFEGSTGYIMDALRTGAGRTLSRRIAAWDARIKAINPNAIDAPILSNHDTARSAGFLMGNAAHMKMAAAIYLLMPGSPFIYYGEEIGMTGSGADENKRQPMVFKAADDTGRPHPPEGADQVQKLESGADEQMNDKDSLLRFYMRVLSLKNRFPQIARGSAKQVDTGHSGICAYSAEYKNDAVYIIHNVTAEPVEIVLENELEGLLIQATLTADSGTVGLLDNVLAMPGYSTVILR